jgi:dihydrofolate reductase
MKIALVAAMAGDDRVIGLNNQMPWHLPVDLAHFKAVTMAKPVVMGRKTWQSIGRLLPGRRNIIISRQPKPSNLKADWVDSIDAALELVAAEPEVMIIGGADIYRQTLPMADTLYLTLIQHNIAGDACFPDYQQFGPWQEVAREERAADGNNPYDCHFITLIKI